jgi:hypothetical protein
VILSEYGAPGKHFGGTSERLRQGTGFDGPRVCRSSPWLVKLCLQPAFFQPRTETNGSRLEGEFDGRMVNACKMETNEPLSLPFPQPVGKGMVICDAEPRVADGLDLGAGDMTSLPGAKLLNPVGVFLREAVAARRLATF